MALCRYMIALKPTALHILKKNAMCTGSAATKLIDVQMDKKSKIALVTMQSPPVNSLNLEVLCEFSNVLTDLEEKKIRGMILTSFSQSVFSAGLDIKEMYRPDIKRAKEFWTTLQEVWLKFYGSMFPTVAVINGHAPAGGCLLSLCCEYRIMLPNFTIGLNETQLGIVAPNWFVASMKNAIGSRASEIALTQGRLFKTDEALNVGLIDEIANSKEEGLKKAEKFVMRFEKVSPDARGLSKLACRSQDISDFVESRDLDLDRFLNFVTLPKVQKGLEYYLESLKKK